MHPEYLGDVDIRVVLENLSNINLQFNSISKVPHGVYAVSAEFDVAGTDRKIIGLRLEPKRD